MPAQLLDRAAAPASVHTRRPTPAVDAGYDALPRLNRLAADLLAVQPRSRSRWKEPRVFFFDRRRQTELETARVITPPADPYAELSTRIAAELPALFASVELRQVARAVNGLRDAAETLASVCPAAKDLVDLLAIPDDEIVTVLHPTLRVGFRLAVRGIADVGQLHILLADAVRDQIPVVPVPGRFVIACRDADPTVAAGVPMVAEARFQMHTPAALQSDGSLPQGFGGSDHWLWPNSPLGRVPRIGGERVVLLGPSAYQATWEVTRRFPLMPAEVQLLEELNPFRTAEWLSKLTGNAVPPMPQREPEPALAKAA